MTDEGSAATPSTTPSESPSETPSQSPSESGRPVLGIDIGGSGIKGAPVDLATGELAAERVRFETPAESTPEKIAKVVLQVVNEFADQIGDGPVGITIPAVVTHGVTRSAANIDKSWIDHPAEKTFEDVIGRDVVLVNDADAAGVAEVKYGAAKDHPGLVLLTTLGTGIGSALIHHGVLVPNTEFGHIEIDGHDAEKRASAKYKEDKGLSYKEWAHKSLQRYYETIEALIWPDLIVVGGGVSRKADKFLPLLKLNAEIIPAKLQNQAGIVGAAWLANDYATHRSEPLIHAAVDPNGGD
jgi:polyphosphate glucokinase